MLICSSHWVWRLLVCQRMTGVISAEASFPIAKLRVRRPGIVMSKPDGVDPLRRCIAWGAMLTGSVVPMMFGHPTGHGPPYSVPATQALVLAVAAIVASRSRRLSPLTGFLFTVAILRLGWSVIAPMLGEWGPVQSFVAEISWGPKIFMSRLLNVASALLMLTTFISRNFSTDDLFLWVGALLWPAFGADRHHYGDDRGMDLGEKHGGNTRCGLGLRHPHGPGRRDLLFPRVVDEKLTHKRVAFAFLTDGRGRPVPGQDCYVIA